MTELTARDADTLPPEQDEAGPARERPMLLYRSSYALMATTAANAVLGLLFWVAAARLYPASTVGLGAAGISALQLVGSVGWVGLQYTLLRYVPAAGRRQRRLVLLTYTAGAVTAGVLAEAFLALLSAPLGVTFLRNSSTTALAFGLAAATWVVFSLEDQVLVAIRKPLLVPITNATFGMLKFGLLVLLAKEATAETLLALWVASAAVMAVLVNTLLFRRLLDNRAPSALPPTRAVARFSLGHSAVGIVALLPDYLVSLLVLASLGRLASAYYFAAWTVGFSARLLISNMASALTAEGAYEEHAFGRLVRSASSLAVLVLTPTILVLTLGARLVLAVFGAAYASAAADLLRCFALSLPFAGVIAVGLALDRARERFGAALLVTSVATTTSLLLDLLLIRSHGITGVGIGWLLGQMAGAAVVLVTFRRDVHPAHSPDPLEAMIEQASRQAAWQPDLAAAVSGRVWCGELELSEPASASLRVPAEYDAARLLVRLHGQPLGFATLATAGGDVQRAHVQRLLRKAMWSRARAHLAAERLPVPSEDAPGPWPAATQRCPQHRTLGVAVTVIVCTRDRPAELQRCLTSLRRLDYPELEILVVDNASQTSASADLVTDLSREDPRFQLVHEPVPGLSRARNRGLLAAHGEVVAYTDDDVTVDPQWVNGLVGGFARGADVGCVTGMVCSASLEGPAEAYFDARVSWAVDCDARVCDLSERRLENRLYPYLTGALGTGANLAFRHAALMRIGGFDESLGAGTAAAGGEDIDAFVRLIQSGASLAYEPSALVWHHHRVTMSALRRQMSAYGSGFSAFIVKHLMDRRTRSQVLERVPAGMGRLIQLPRDTKNALGSSTPLPRGLVLSEYFGMLSGPFLYALSRRRARRSPALVPGPQVAVRGVS